MIHEKLAQLSESRVSFLINCGTLKHNQLSNLGATFLTLTLIMCCRKVRGPHSVNDRICYLFVSYFINIRISSSSNQSNLSHLTTSTNLWTTYLFSWIISVPIILKFGFVQGIVCLNTLSIAQIHNIISIVQCAAIRNDEKNPTRRNRTASELYLICLLTRITARREPIKRTVEIEVRVSIFIKRNDQHLGNIFTTETAKILLRYCEEVVSISSFLIF